MQVGDTVQLTSEAVEARILIDRHYPSRATNPGKGRVVSVAAPMAGCVIVRFDLGGEMQIHPSWLESA